MDRETLKKAIDLNENIGYIEDFIDKLHDLKSDYGIDVSWGKLYIYLGKEKYEKLIDFAINSANENLQSMKTEFNAL